MVRHLLLLEPRCQQKHRTSNCPTRANNSKDTEALLWRRNLQLHTTSQEGPVRMQVVLELALEGWSFSQFTEAVLVLSS